MRGAKLGKGKERVEGRGREGRERELLRVCTVCMLVHVECSSCTCTYPCHSVGSYIADQYLLSQSGCGVPSLLALLTKHTHEQVATLFLCSSSSIHVFVKFYACTRAAEVGSCVLILDSLGTFRLTKKLHGFYSATNHTKALWWVLFFFFLHIVKCSKL